MPEQDDYVLDVHTYMGDDPNVAMQPTQSLQPRYTNNNGVVEELPQPPSKSKKDEE